VFVLTRAIVYAAVFIGFFLVYLPARILERAGIPVPVDMGIQQVIGGLLVALGALLAVSCIITFAIIGKGTPAPFDAPRRLVTRGVYAWIRNPMYVGAWLVLSGTAFCFHSRELAWFAAAFILCTIALVHLHEESVLRRQFGSEYEAYCAKVGRWWPRGSR
jgi:protein-S-isoprenylcysteine O-methyltransferase Ste14